jgi:hypothetical protein
MPLIKLLFGFLLGFLELLDFFPVPVLFSSKASVLSLLWIKCYLLVDIFFKIVGIIYVTVPNYSMISTFVTMFARF